MTQMDTWIDPIWIFSGWYTLFKQIRNLVHIMSPSLTEKKKAGQKSYAAPKHPLSLQCKLRWNILIRGFLHGRQVKNEKKNPVCQMIILENVSSNGIPKCSPVWTGGQSRDDTRLSSLSNQVFDSQILFSYSLYGVWNILRAQMTSLRGESLWSFTKKKTFPWLGVTKTSWEDRDRERERTW